MDILASTISILNDRLTLSENRISQLSMAESTLYSQHTPIPESTSLFHTGESLRRESLQGVKQSHDIQLSVGLPVPADGLPDESGQGSHLASNK